MSSVFHDAPVVLIHGAATTAAIWSPVSEQLVAAGRTVAAPQRAYSGSLDGEIDALVPLCPGAIVVGVSGGATLALELAARGVPFLAALAHEPAVGSLLPGLLAPVVAALAADGVRGFGRTLYGPSWTPGDAPPDPEAVARDLAMFRAFEPRPAAPGAGPVLVTVGSASPAVRHEAAAALHAACGYPIEELPGAGHGAHLDAVDALVDRILHLA
jgi:pimeloyl-ACP methyl ester carboxylesterase